jgi:hypothetical protein
VGLGLDKGLLQQKAIADGAGTAAVAAPISGEGLNPPAELLGSATDGAISATGPAMEQQMDRPATAALEQGRGNALLGPDEITATSGDDDDRAMGQRRVGRRPREGNAVAWATAAEDKLMGYRANERGKLSEDY